MKPRRTCLCHLAILLALTAAAPWGFGQTAQATSKPISADPGPIGAALRKWAAEGSAAGNVADFYDNRDRGHSRLDITPYPQLKAITYSDAENQRGANWGAQRTLRPEVTFGNSSTASPAAISGSNTRLLYVTPGGLSFLSNAYRHNNLYVYPCHQDHSPGHDGLNGGGFGDLFPTNTPYLITSQGSSYTDQPFLKAIASTLAAFRPEVKSRLIDAGLLMPTVQMIFRMSNKQVATPEDYLTGKAHPTVFEGNQVDAMKMVNMAHAIDLQHIPPLAQIELVGVDDVRPGRDFVDPVPGESLGETPEVIARIFRGSTGVRHLAVSAAGSKDVNDLPLTYHWVVLRGDPREVTISPRDKDGKVVDITLPYHGRAPIAPASPMESNRVDIGLFVHNGTYYSAPAFVTSFSLDNESREIDSSGRVLEIGYDASESTVTIDNWGPLVAALHNDPPKGGVRLLTASLSAAELAVLRTIGNEYVFSGDRIADLNRQAKELEETVKKVSPLSKAKLEAQLKSLRDTIDTANRSRDIMISTKRPGLAQPARVLLQDRINTLLNDPLLYVQQGATLGPLPPSVESARKRLLAYGIITESAGQPFVLNPLLPGSTPPEQRLSRYQKSLLVRFNGELLAAVIPGARHETRRNLVDFRLTLPKNWRDVYHYATDGRLTGWTRYDGQTATEFAPNGEIMIDHDSLGRPVATRPVTYQRQAASPLAAANGPDMTPLTYAPADKVVYYAYNGPDDLDGHVDHVEQLPPSSSGLGPRLKK